VINNRQLSYSAAYTGLKNLLKFAGLDSEKFALHSARIGAASDAFEANVPFYVIDAKGRWKSHSSKFSYLRVKDRKVVIHGHDNLY
jgi:hypothetical protein